MRKIQKMKLALLKCSTSTNIGDEIQSLAVKQHLKNKNVLYVDRDNLNSYDGENCVVVMNGWFSHIPENFPPSNKITPIFFGFHITQPAYEKYKKHVAYFKKYEPIGCRDIQTMEALKKWGVKSYLSGCATMTFPERLKQPTTPKVMLVDVRKKYFRKNERNNLLFNSHDLLTPILKNETKFQIAEEFLNYYHDHAGLVVTSKIHCAMPCFAMGIPTIYAGVQDERTAVVDLIGLPKIKLPLFGYLSYETLPFLTPKYQDLKNSITDNLKKQLNDHNINTV